MKGTITIVYNYETDKTTVKVDQGFKSLPDIHRADALKDALYDLENMYHKVLAEMRKPRKKLSEAQQTH